MHATAYLKNPDDATTGPIVVIYGPVRYLQKQVEQAVAKTVLDAGDDGEIDEMSLTRFVGRDADLASVSDELRTVSMWGDQRLVVVEEADEFVKNFRSGLEKYLESPAKKAVLVLLMKSWPKNTRLAKAVAKCGLDVDCAELKGGQLQRWLTDTARDVYEKQLGRTAAAEMVELAGSDLGLLDQELAKLSAYVGDRTAIEPEDVRTLVGGWKAETTWIMLAKLQEGDLATALNCLDRLLAANEAPQRILGGITFTFRRLTSAIERARQGRALSVALKDSGIYRQDEIDRNARYLRRIGRPNAERILDRLIAADGNMKGGSPLPAAVQLERLMIDLSGRAESPTQTAAGR